MAIAIHGSLGRHIEAEPPIDCPPSERVANFELVTGAGRQAKAHEATAILSVRERRSHRAARTSDVCASAPSITPPQTSLLQKNPIPTTLVARARPAGTPRLTAARMIRSAAHRRRRTPRWAFAEREREREPESECQPVTRGALASYDTARAACRVGGRG